MSVLDWRNLVFYIPLALAALLAVGAGVGLDHDHSDAGGPLPITMRIMLVAFLFGGMGLLIAPWLWALAPRSAALGGCLAVAGSAGLTWLVSATVGRSLARRWRLFESAALRRADLVGAAGRLVVGGMVQVRDPHGDLHVLPCRPAPGEPPLVAGEVAFLLDYDDVTGTFLVQRYPP